MPDIDIEALRAAAEKATPGPWELIESSAWGYTALWNPETRQEILVPGGQNDGDSPEVWMGEEMTEADKAFIECANPTAVLALLSRLTAAEAENADLRAELKALNEGAAHNAAIDRDEIQYWKDRAHVP